MDASILARISHISANERSVMTMSAGALSDSAMPFDNMPLRRRDYIWNVIGSRQMVSSHMHTRFTDIPVHSHSYLEMMYVCAGSVSHQIEGHSYRMEAGELLLMNRHVRHSITASGEGDIAVNYIISRDFLSYAASRFRGSPHLREFADEDRKEDGKARFLLFCVKEHPAVENLLENLIRETLLKSGASQALLADTLSLVFRYFETVPSLLVHGSPEEGEGNSLRRTVSDYLETSYRTATLTELSELVGMTPPYVSRRITELFGASFSDLVKEKRFAEAERLLLHSDMPVSAIAEAIGYENNSFFHRRFREQYGTSPAKWRKRDA
ncbi:MAG: AraC family transcriptional regulator [Ruminococcaceae bacterium]|nr:AraC family transcriptional regulator [Oscillospiraceae bacterium]